MENKQQRAGEETRPADDAIDNDIHQVLLGINTVLSLLWQQLTAIKQLASIEARLSIRCLLVSAAALLCGAALLVCLWISVLVFTAWYLHTAGLPIIFNGAIILVMQCIALYFCQRMLANALYHVGFGQTRRAIKTAMTPASEEAPPHPARA